MTLYAKTIGQVTYTFTSGTRNSPSYKMDSTVRVLPLWVAQLPDFTRLWAVNRIVVSTDLAQTQVVTTIPSSELPSGTPGGGTVGGIADVPGLQAALAAKADAAAVTAITLNHDFTNDTDGAPVTADSGQTWEKHQLRAQSAPAVVGGRYVSNDTLSGLASTYLGADLGAYVTYLECDFDYTAGGSTQGGGPVILATAASVASSIGAGVFNATAHVSFSKTGYTVGVFNGATIQTVLGSQTYSAPFTTQTQHIEIALDKLGGYMYVRGADGAVNRYSSSVISSTVATHATAEVYYTDASTDARVRISRFAADVSKTKFQSVVNDYGLLGGSLAPYAKTSDVVAYAAPIANPTFTGNVTVPTPTSGLLAANKNYVDASGAGDPDYTILKNGSTYTAYPRAGSGLAQLSGTNGTVINNAVLALCPVGGARGSGGGTIQFGAGAFDLGGVQVNIVGWETASLASYPLSQLTIRGLGPQTQFVQTGSGHAFKVNNCANVRFQDFYIYVGSSGKSGIVYDNDGTSNMGGWKPHIENVEILSASTTNPALHLKNFFSLTMPKALVEASGYHAVVLENNDAATHFGNSHIGYLMAKHSGQNAAMAGLALISNHATDTYQKINLLSVDHFESVTYGGIGLYTKGAAFVDFGYVDIEMTDTCVFFDSTSLTDRNTRHIRINNGYAICKDGGTVIKGSLGAGGNFVRMRTDSGSANSATVINDPMQFLPANTYELFVGTVATSPVTIAYPAYQRVRLICDDTTISDNEIASTTHNAVVKATPIDADELPLSDSAANWGLKRLSLANLKAVLKTYFDSLATSLSNKTIVAPVFSGTSSGTYTVGGTYTLNAPIVSGTITGTYTIGGTPTFPTTVLQTTSTQTGITGKTFTAPRITSASNIADANGNALITIPSVVASAVNAITVTNAVATGTPSIAASGTDTNINLGLFGKGTGAVLINNQRAGVSERLIVSTSGTLTAQLVNSTHFLVLLTAGAVPTLPTAVGTMARYSLKNTTGANIVLSTTSSQTIDGATSYTMIPLEAITVISDNANWWIIQ